ncbi:unnamed protein product [Dovyalis caffra]|uniref:Uncharacterized protein n=1 Tax=Dovyalis caffra TaxID=77055 RepID=A0AAV1SHH6_9ROSI|nr:unnamed protein product [Dovyalis caffra]
MEKSKDFSYHGLTAWTRWRSLEDCEVDGAGQSEFVEKIGERELDGESVVGLLLGAGTKAAQSDVDLHKKQHESELENISKGKKERELGRKQCNDLDKQADLEDKRDELEDSLTTVALEVGRQVTAGDLEPCVATSVCDVEETCAE